MRPSIICLFLWISGLVSAFVVNSVVPGASLGSSGFTSKGIALKTGAFPKQPGYQQPQQARDQVLFYHGTSMSMQGGKTTSRVDGGTMSKGPTERSQDNSVFEKGKKNRFLDDLKKKVKQVIDERTCESDDDCDYGYVCCDLFVVKTCCTSSGLFAEPYERAPQMIPIPIPVDDPYPPGYPPQYPPQGGRYPY